MEKVIPFSNGTESMNWFTVNCDRCKARNCTAKQALEYSFLSGEITKSMAERIGYIKDWGLENRCKMFTTEIQHTQKRPNNDPKLFD